MSQRWKHLARAQWVRRRSCIRKWWKHKQSQRISVTI